MRKLDLIVVAVVAFGSVTACQAQQASSSLVATTGPSLAPPSVSVDAAGGQNKSPKFEPSTLSIHKGDVVGVVDTGDTLHDFTIDVGGAVPTKPDDQHIAVQIKVDLVNKTNQAAIDLPPGTYQFYCSVALGNGAGHAIEGMVGTITVQ